MPLPVASGPRSSPVRWLNSRASIWRSIASVRVVPVSERLLADLATFYGGGRTVGDVLRRMRCSSACGGRVGAAWLVTGPVLNARVRPRRVALLAPEAQE